MKTLDITSTCIKAIEHFENAEQILGTVLETQVKIAETLENIKQLTR